MTTPDDALGRGTCGPDSEKPQMDDNTNGRDETEQEDTCSSACLCNDGDDESWAAAYARGQEVTEDLDALTRTYKFDAGEWQDAIVWSDGPGGEHRTEMVPADEAMDRIAEKAAEAAPEAATVYCHDRETGESYEVNLVELQQAVARNAEAIDGLREDYAGLETEIDSLRAEVSGLNTVVARSLRKSHDRIAELEAKLDELEGRLW